MKSKIASDQASALKKKHIHFIERTHAFINIDRSIVEKLQLTEEDSFSEEVTVDGILLRRQNN